MDTSHISTISRRRRCLNDKQFNFKSFVHVLINVLQCSNVFTQLCIFVTNPRFSRFTKNISGKWFVFLYYSCFLCEWQQKYEEWKISVFSLVMKITLTKEKKIWMLSWTTCPTRWRGSDTHAKWSLVAAPPRPYLRPKAAHSVGCAHKGSLLLALDTLEPHICGCGKARTLMTQWNALLSIVNLSNDVVKSKRLFGCEWVGGAGAESLATPGLAAHRSTTSFRLSSRCVRPDPLFQSAVDTCSLDLLLPSELST